MDDLTFRRATEEEIPQIIALQAEVFCGEQDIPVELIDTFLSNRAVCWCAEQDNRIVASISAWEENGETHLGRFIVLPELRGQQIGSKLLNHVIRELFDSGVEKLYGEARDSVVRIARTMGARSTGEPFGFYRGNVTPMILEKDAFTEKEARLRQEGRDSDQKSD